MLFFSLNEDSYFLSHTTIFSCNSSVVNTGCDYSRSILGFHVRTANVLYPSLKYSAYFSPYFLKSIEWLFSSDLNIYPDVIKASLYVLKKLKVNISIILFGDPAAVFNILYSD